MANIAWARVAARFEGVAAEKKPHTVTTPDARKMLEADPDLLALAVEAPSSDVDFARCTIFGRTAVRSIEAENSLFLGTARAAQGVVIGHDATLPFGTGPRVTARLTLC